MLISFIVAHRGVMAYISKYRKSSLEYNREEQMKMIKENGEEGDRRRTSKFYNFSLEIEEVTLYRSLPSPC